MSKTPSSRGDGETPRERLSLVFLRGGQEGRRVSIEDDRSTVVLGRADASDIRVDPEVDRVVSGRHLEFRRRGEGWSVVDLGSSNGTTLNGEQLTRETSLNAGDVLELGAGSSFDGVLLRIEAAGSSASTGASAAGPAAPPPPTPSPRVSPPPPPKKATSKSTVRRLPDGGIAFSCDACGATQRAQAGEFGTRRRCDACSVEILIPIPVSISARPGKSIGGAGADESRRFGAGVEAQDAVDRLIGGGLRRVREGMSRMRSGPRRRELEREVAEFERRIETLHESLGRHLLEVRGPDGIRESSAACADALDERDAAIAARDAEQVRIEALIEDARQAEAAAEAESTRVEQAAQDNRKTLAEGEARLKALIESRRERLASVLESIADFEQRIARIPTTLEDPTIAAASLIEETCRASAETFSTMVESLPDLSELEGELAALHEEHLSVIEAGRALDEERRKAADHLAACRLAGTEAQALPSGTEIAACLARVERSEQALAQALVVVARDAMSQADPVAVASEHFPEIRSLERRAKQCTDELAGLDRGGGHG